MKIAEIASSPFAEKGRLLASFCKSEGICDLEYEAFPCDETRFKEVLTGLMGSADVIRVSSPFAEFIIPELPNMTSEIQTIGACDLLIKEDGMWWPRNFLGKAFYKTISEDMGRLDLSNSAFVVGAGASARSVVSAVVRSGYTKITLTDKFVERGMETVEAIKKKMFKINIEFVPMQAITTLPGVFSLVVNTSPLVLENDLLDELYFFNFLKEGGIVVDLQTVPPQTPLLMEAATWGARFLSGDYIAAHFDGEIIEYLTKVQFPTEKYRQLLRALLDKIPFDGAPFLRRFQDR